jgi:hypothetical protein
MPFDMPPPQASNAIVTTSDALPDTSTIIPLAANASPVTCFACTPRYDGG